MVVELLKWLDSHGHELAVRAVQKHCSKILRPPSASLMVVVFKGERLRRASLFDQKD
jgi:hypothetical protein